MVARKITFTLPEALVAELIRNVPARKRSSYVAEALAAKLRSQDEALALACDIANQDEDVLAIEREFDAIPAEVPEPWQNASTR